MLRCAPGFATPLRLAVACFVLASVLLGPHGAGALASDDDCACDAAGALAEGAGADLELGGDAEDECPPGCECDCCGSPVAAETSRMSLGPVGSVALPLPRGGASDAPPGERVDVFRPPRV